MSRDFVKKELGAGLPPSLPLVLPSECSYNFNTHQITHQSNGEHGTEDKTSGIEIKLVPETVGLLQGVSKPVAVLSMCGPFRSGKSYFLSRVLGAQETFQLGHTVAACTRGIWMASSVLECEEFVVILLDTEGIGAPDRMGSGSGMSQLLVLLMLTSSMLVYNSMNVPRGKDLCQLRCVDLLTFASPLSVGMVETDQPDHVQLMSSEI
jgi:hypothetical protein